MQEKEENKKEDEEVKKTEGNDGNVVSKENDETKEEQLSADFIYPPTQLGKAILALLSEENQESEEIWEEFFTAFYDSELWFGAFIEKNEKGEDVLYPIPSAQEDGTESMIVFERGSELAAWYQEGAEESRNDIFLVAKTGDRFLKDIAPEAFEKFGNLLISYGRNNHECFIVDEETLKIMREALEDLKTGE